MTITLPPQVETPLRRRAAQTGMDADTLAGALLLDALTETQGGALREEYHQLVALQLRGHLSLEQTERLRTVVEELDDLDAQSPAAQAMAQRLGETDRKLDEMLALLRVLPSVEQAE